MEKYENLKIYKNCENEYFLILKLGKDLEKTCKISFSSSEPTNSDIKRTLKSIFNDINFNLIDKKVI